MSWLRFDIYLSNIDDRLWREQVPNGTQMVNLDDEFLKENLKIGKPMLRKYILDSIKEEISSESNFVIKRSKVKSIVRVIDSLEY